MTGRVGQTRIFTSREGRNYILLLNELERFQKQMIKLVKINIL